MSLAKLTSLSTQTLSLLLEQQRLHTLPSFSSPLDVQSTKPPSLHLPQITKNLNRLRTGILDLEAKEGPSEALRLLRNQHGRMRGMLGEEGAAIESLEPVKESPRTPSPPATPVSDFPPKPPAKDAEPLYSPYTDDPETGGDPGIMLQTQRHMMNEQDEHLDRLSQSIGRQHHISLQINDELDVHTGLLQELDTDLDRTENRLTNARRRLDTVAQGAKDNVSTVTIGLLIFVLLILIIIFKT